MIDKERLNEVIDSEKQEDNSNIEVDNLYEKFKK